MRFYEGVQDVHICELVCSSVLVVKAYGQPGYKFYNGLRKIRRKFAWLRAHER